MMSAQCIPSWRNSTRCICGSSRAFGKRILENIIYYISLILPWNSVQSLRGIMWSCWVGLCGVFIVGYELPFLWSNMLTPREEIKNEIDALCSIEIRQHDLDVFEDFDEKVIFEADLSVSIKLLQYTSVFVCSMLGFIQWKKYFPFLLMTKKNHLCKKTPTTLWQPTIMPFKYNWCEFFAHLLKCHPCEKLMCLPLVPKVDIVVWTLLVPKVTLQILLLSTGSSWIMKITI